MKIERPAAKIKQGDLTIFTTSLYVKDLLEKDFYRIDRLDPTLNNPEGYQRLLDKNRTKRFAEYLIRAWKDGDAYLPTSIFLATEKKIKYNKEKNTIVFDTSEIGAFNVVDGQHRIAGLIQAVEEMPDLREFQIPANIAVNLDTISQMCHFLIVNSTQKAVDKAIVQQIQARLTDMINIEDYPTLPKWIKRQVEKGDDRDALIIAEFLNTENDSPWKDKILMANEKNNSYTIKQNSFVNSLKKYILSTNNPITRTDFKKRNKILKNYWKAIDNVLNKSKQLDKSALYKTIGLDMFNQVSPAVFTQLFLKKNFKVVEIESLLKAALENLPPDYIKVGYAEFWKKGADASGLNQAAVSKYVSEINKAISTSIDEIDDIEI